MAGYSGAPLGKKLGLREEMKAYLVDVPPELTALFCVLEVQARPQAPLDYVHIFTTDQARLAMLLPAVAAALDDRGLLWISWPKKASRRATTVDEHVARALGLATGLVDVKVCAVDDVWSGLKFVRRVVDRKR